MECQEFKKNDEEKSVKKKNKAAIGAGIAVGAVAALYAVGSIFFMGRFKPGTTINAINVSYKTVDDAANLIQNDYAGYKLDLEGKDGVVGSIEGADINFSSENLSTGVKDLKSNQSAFGWISGFFGKSEYELSEGFTFDESSLQSAVDKLDCVTTEETEPAREPDFSYNGGQYDIVPEEPSTKIVKENLLSAAESSLKQGKKTLNLGEADCFEKAKFTADSPEVKKAKEALDNYAKACVTYKMGDKTEVVDGSYIIDFVKIDKDTFEVSLDKELIRAHMIELQKKYSPQQKTRNFTTHDGRKIQIDGGDYGFSAKYDGQTDVVEEAIKNGEVKTVELETTTPYTDTDENGDDIGSTYVEVDLGQQHLWIYKNGQAVLDTPIVSGNVSAGHTTPGGVYSLKSKERNAVLRGANYASPVSYWMPFNGGIGIHDANWRGQFGGSIYRTSGSHGCVNAPSGIAGKIFENVEIGMPVVCYY